ncbi:hypothetical protein ACFPYI_17760 [Halomarina salina]|uniref:PH domain-containing protein n=1 Tax=Halomarina salina TaxID=1872699 RepID=A0ABD5RR75_9EURY|nr:hypothetical protein [Halomarina salina]
MSRPPHLASLSIALWYALAVAGILGIAPVGPPVAAVVGLLVGVGVFLVSRRADLPSVFARSRLHYLLPLLPLALGVTVVVLDVSGAVDVGVSETSSAPPSVVLALLLGAVLVVVGGVALVAADNRYAARKRATERELATWVAPIDETHHRRVRRVYLASAVVATLLGGVAVGSGIDLGMGLFSFAVATGLMAFTALDKPTEYTALDGGVVVSPTEGIRERYLSWGAFERSERTDEAIVLRRRLPGTSLHCSLDALEDSDAVERLLAHRIG